jgi:hypothetical protein
MGLGELRHRGWRPHEQRRVAGQDRLAPDRYGQMRFADNSSTTSVLAMSA